MAANAVHTTKISPVDEGICPQDQLITVSKCTRGTMISCSSGLREEVFACDADGYPFRVNAAKTPLISVPALSRAPAYAKPQEYAYRHSHGRRRGRHDFFDFLSSIFRPHGRKN